MPNGKNVRAHTTKSPLGDDRTLRKTTNRSRFSEQDKLRAVAALVAHGGLTEKGVAEARSLIGSQVGVSSLHAWLREYGDRVRAANSEIVIQEERRVEASRTDVAAIVASAREEMGVMLQTISEKLLRSIDDKAIANASLRDRMVSFGIASDKLNALRGISPETAELIMQLQQECRLRDAGYNVNDILRQAVAALRKANEIEAARDADTQARGGEGTAAGG